MELADTRHEINNRTRNSSPGFWKSIVLNKLSAPPVYIGLFALSLLCAVLIGTKGLVPGILILIFLIGVPVVYGVVAHPQFGITVLFVAAYLLFIPMKMDTGGFPLGTVMDILEYLLILGFFVKQKTDTNWSIFKDRLSYFTMAWIAYNFAEVGNPSSISPLAWVYTIRTTAVVITMYFVFVYQIRDQSFIKLIFKIWIALAIVGAADGFKQENFGYFQSEHDYLYGDPGRVALLFIDGHMRKFSIFSDPVAFAYNMASASVLCITLMFGPIKVYKKYILGVIVAFLMFCMLYSGTRGAFPLVPASLLMLAILNYNKTVLKFAIAAAIFFVGLIFVPTSNPSIVRFQTAFRPNNDPSFNLRKMNQARIRPFILSHPLGGGLGSTGVWGQKFAPGSMLANFPPDSGYVRVAVESGTIGILLLCSLVFVALLTGINNFYLIRDPVLKNYSLAATLVVFTYNIGNYPQEAIVQFPSNVIFFLCMALITICRRLDREKQNLAVQ
ncbi:O-antigen ligase family protein [Mucilaginibacter sp. PPCGB 2223]|uniref:O-antigen ligase family protein n=1 Tax=Mucilaginibacter sp. PPCGB 2223 TaxID=1886027 RepID=UPI0009F74231|nr:O-antigen ligase family protein [Mucilaginibacter sp. PPCGB 2223]